MAFDAHKNLAYSTVVTPPAPAASGTTLTLQTGEGARFPTANFPVTVWPAGTIPTPSNAEIAYCTARGGDALTLVRAAELGPARSIVVGDQVIAGMTVKTITDLETSPAFTGTPTAPTAAAGTATTQLATTAFVMASSGAESLTANGPTIALSAGYTQHVIALGANGPLAWTGPAAVGDRVWLVNRSGVVATVAHGASGGSILNIATSAPTPIALNGFAEYVYIPGGWVLVAHDQGAWIAPPYSAANFTSAGTWTVDAADVLMMAYRLCGRTLHVAWAINATSLAVATTSLSIGNGAWGGFTASGAQFMGYHTMVDGGISNAGGFCQVGSQISTTAIWLYKNAATAWNSGTNNINTQGQLTFQVQ